MTYIHLQPCTHLLSTVRESDPSHYDTIAMDVRALVDGPISAAAPPVTSAATTPVRNA